MNRFGVVVNRGFESVALRQIEDITGSKSITIDDSIVLFESDKTSACEFIYRSQIALRVISVLSRAGLGEASSYDAQFSKILCKEVSSNNVLDQLRPIISHGIKNFKVRIDCDEHTDLTSVEAEIGSVIIEKTSLGVDLKNPQMLLYIYVRSGTAYIGIDLSGELGQRDYRIFNNAVSIKGTTAFGLLMLSGYRRGETYLDPFCYSGTIEIEAGLYASGKSHRFYNKSFPFMKLLLPLGKDGSWDSFFGSIDKRINAGKETGIGKITGSDPILGSITAAVKNAKIAGVEDLINFRRIDIDWLELKFEEGSIDSIVTFVPGSSKHKDLSKLFKEFFYQAEHILQRKGTISVMCLSKDLLIKESSEYFIIQSEHHVQSGMENLYIITFARRSIKKG